MKNSIMTVLAVIMLVAAPHLVLANSTVTVNFSGLNYPEFYQITSEFSDQGIVFYSFGIFAPAQNIVRITGDGTGELTNPGGILFLTPVKKVTVTLEDRNLNPQTYCIYAYDSSGELLDSACSPDRGVFQTITLDVKDKGIVFLEFSTSPPGASVLRTITFK
jgi:hypothetical protein